MRFAFVYTGIRVTDMEAALRFFCEGLGMKLLDRSPVPETGGEIANLVSKEGGPRLELNWYPPGSRYGYAYDAGEALDHLAFSYSGGTLEEAIRRLVAAGGKLRIEPFLEGTTMLAYVDSPDGQTIELFAQS